MPLRCYVAHAPLKSKGEKGKTKLIITEGIFPCTTSNRRCSSVFISTSICIAERESCTSFCAFHASREMWVFFHTLASSPKRDFCIIVTTRADQRENSLETVRMFPYTISWTAFHCGTALTSPSVISSIFRMSATALEGTGENPQFLGYVCLFYFF